MQVPEFLLRRLYVRGSLRNTDDGFAFDLANALGSGYAERVLPLTLDGEEIPLEAARFVADGAVTPFSEVAPDRPFTLAMNGALTVAVRGPALAPGKHRVGVGFVVTGMGEMRFEVSDAIAGAGGDGAD